ncbi:MAG TPA: ABC transporter ATP-binding protein [Bacillota bacterium]
MSHQIELKNIVKKYGEFRAVDNVSFTVDKGEFFTLLGPSGCGKTTLLRMIAGFNSIEEGEIYFDAELINNIPAHKRDIGMVFQNYAIFPHMSVYENVAYGLKARKVPKQEMVEKINEALKMAQIDNLRDRQPANMSGGQQQRVALARAIVIHPRLLLMDEPLSNLDAKLRVEMRTVIKELQHNLGITTIYVTHDQEEALSISDRIAVMNKGQVIQIGKPETIYRRPVNEFVAGFIGTSNFLTGEIVGVDAQQNAEIKIGDSMVVALKCKAVRKGSIKLSIRPEEFIIKKQSEAGLPGIISQKTFLGDFINYVVRLDNGQTVQVNEYCKDNEEIREIGEVIRLDFIKDKINIFNETGEESLL